MSTRSPADFFATSTEGYMGPVNQRPRTEVSSLLQRGTPRSGSRILGRFGRTFGLALGLAVAASGFGVASPARADGVPATPAQPAPKKAPKSKGEKVKAALDEAPPTASGKVSGKEAKEEASEVKAARGVVVLSRAGIPVGLGAVLGGDGRILTALSPLGSGNDLDARFADGTSAKVKLGHHDRAWDLALLVPQSGKWNEGLTASGADPLHEDADIHTFSAMPGAKPAPTSVELTSKRTIIGGDDRSLDDALELGSRINPLNLGAPLVDETGRVVGIIGRGCMPVEGKPCIPVAFGIPVQAIKSFLRNVPADATQPSPFLGIQGAKETGAVAKGVRILSIAKGSPAAFAKLRAGDKADGDMILAVGGEPVTTPEELAQAIRKHAIGEKVPLTVFGKNAYRQVEVLLGSPAEARTAAALPAPKPGAGPKPAPASKPAVQKEPEAAPEAPSDPFGKPM